MPSPSRLPFRQRLLDYLLQVSLIIVGLIIATSVDRCNSARKDDRRLQSYYAAILTDLEEERESNAMNLVDADRDVTDLYDAITLLEHPDADSVRTGVGKVNAVLNKGVFRTFSPTTFDVMVNTGDVILIEDIALRSQLAAAFAFRENILQPDLQEYDQQVLATVKSISDRIDPACVTTMRDDLDCILDATAIRQRGMPELHILATVARKRRFHLQLAQEQILDAIDRVGEEYSGS